MADRRPINCRNVLKEAGLTHPKSGCEYCKNGGLMGCPFDDKKDNSKNLIDHYHIHGNDYDVYELGPGAFQVWMTKKNGENYEIKIAPTPASLTEVRSMLFSYAHSQLNAEYHGIQEMLIKAQQDLDKLRGSVYNLENFRKMI